MDYHTHETTRRAKQSSLWPDLEWQDGKALPYLLERYLLLENWNYLSRFDEAYQEHTGDHIDPNRHDYDLNYLHLLLAEATTVLLNQEERIRKLEAALLTGAEAPAPLESNNQDQVQTPRREA